MLNAKCDHNFMLEHIPEEDKAGLIKMHEESGIERDASESDNDYILRSAIYNSVSTWEKAMQNTAENKDSEFSGLIPLLDNETGEPKLVQLSGDVLGGYMDPKDGSLHLILDNNGKEIVDLDLGVQSNNVVKASASA